MTGDARFASAGDKRPSPVELYLVALRCISNRIEHEHDAECLRVLCEEQRELLSLVAELPS